MKQQDSNAARQNFLDLGSWDKVNKIWSNNIICCYHIESWWLL